MILDMIWRALSEKKAEILKDANDEVPTLRGHWGASALLGPGEQLEDDVQDLRVLESLRAIEIREACDASDEISLRSGFQSEIATPVDRD